MGPGNRIARHSLAECGDASMKLNASGYFRTEKVSGRWTVIDPDGHPFIVSAMNSFRQGKSPNNEKAFLIVFPTAFANCTRNTFLS